MSGIAGIVARSGQPVNEATLGKMIEAIGHRGPDRSGAWADGVIGLAHCMLETTPESVKERQPARLETPDLTITADARIDNRAELAEALWLTPPDLAESSDSALILRAYAKWGIDCPSHLIGDFAFAIWDGTERRLFAARDGTGVKPLYYHVGAGRFAFASEIKGILALPGTSVRINEDRLAALLIGDFRDQSATAYSDILRLPPAHRMTYQGGDIRTGRYWSLDADREFRCADRRDYVEGFREIFTEAVRTRIRSAYPVATALSGGLDSSSITVVAAKLREEQGLHPPLACSAVFPTVARLHPAIDERRHVDAVRRGARVAARDVRADMIRPMTDTAYDEDEPWPAHSLYMSHRIFDTLNSEGARVYVTGHGGDDMVSFGDDHYVELLNRGDWSGFAELARAVSGRVGISPQRQFWYFGEGAFTSFAQARRWRHMLAGARAVGGALSIPASRILYRTAVKPFLPGSILSAVGALRGAPSGTADPSYPLRSVLSPAFARKLRIKERWRDQHLPRRSTSRSTRAALASSLTESGMWEFVATVLGHASARRGIEQRFPYYDRRVLEYCIALPHDLKIHNGWPRSLLREAFDGLLPPEVQWRIDKANLFGNLQVQMSRELSDWFPMHADYADARLTAILDLDAVNAVASKVAASPSSADYDDVTALFFAIRLRSWFASLGDT